MKNIEFDEFIGIDVSKKTIDVFMHFAQKHKQFPNTEEGFHELLKWVQIPAPKICFCLEHCGMYAYHLCSYLSSYNLVYFVVSGLTVKLSLGIKRGKNDKADARALARYACIHLPELTPYQLPEEQLLLIKNLLSFRSRLVKQLSGHKAFLKEATQVLGLPETDFSIHATMELIAALKTTIRQAEKEIAAIIKESQPLNQTYQLITAIKGVGPTVACYLIATTNNFKNFASWRKLACFAGIAPFDHRSGSSLRGKTRVSHLANIMLKTLLNQAAASSIQHNAEMKIYYQKRVKLGKNKMSTLNIIRNKLLARIFAVAKRGTPFIDTYKFAA